MNCCKNICENISILHSMSYSLNGKFTIDCIYQYVSNFYNAIQQFIDFFFLKERDKKFVLEISTLEPINDCFKEKIDIYSFGSIFRISLQETLLHY